MKYVCIYISWKKLWQHFIVNRRKSHIHFHTKSIIVFVIISKIYNNWMLYINIKTTMLHVLMCAKTVQKLSRTSFATLVEQLITRWLWHFYISIFYIHSFKSSISPFFFFLFNLLPFDYISLRISFFSFSLSYFFLVKTAY